MRIRLAVVAAVIALAFALAGAARASSINLVWQGGGNVATVAASATLVADIVVTIAEVNINTVGWNISWDAELAYVTSMLASAPTTPIPGTTNWGNFSSLGGPGASTGTSPGTQRVYHLNAGPGASLIPGTATVGTITFHVTPAVASDGGPATVAGTTGQFAGPTPISGDVSADFVNTNNGAFCTINGIGYCTGQFTITGASVNLVPEPGTLALLMLGLGGLGLVGLRSRS